MKKNTFFILTLLLLISSATLLAQEKKGIIAGIFPNRFDSRWRNDSKAIENASYKMNFKYLAFYGDDSAQSLVKLIDRASRNKVDTIILPIDKSIENSSIIERAKELGIDVVTYLNTPDTVNGVSMHIAFNYTRAGYNQILYTFDKVPYGTYLFMMGIPTDYRFIDSYSGSIEAFKIAAIRNSINVISHPYQIGSTLNDIKNIVKRHISNNRNITSIIMPDDNMSSAVVSAIKELGLESKIFVSGQNITPISASYILDNTQMMSSYAHQNILVLEAIKIAYEIALTGHHKSNDNGNPIIIGGRALPTYYVYPQIIDKSNLKKDIFDKGYIRYNASLRAKIANIDSHKSE